MATAPIGRLRRLIGEIVDPHTPVLIQGETGPGKKLVALGLPKASGPSGRFVVTNCSGLPENLIEGEPSALNPARSPNRQKAHGKAQQQAAISKATGH